MSKYAKFIVAALGAILTVVVQQYGANEWVQAVLPVLTALGVYQIPNAE